MKKLLLAGTNIIHTYNYYNLISDYFDEILLITDSLNPNYPDIKASIVNFSFRNPLQMLKSISAIKKIISSFQPDIIHIHQAGTHAFLVQKANRKSAIPVVLTAWGSDILYVPQKGCLYKNLVKSIINHADYITSDSLYMAEMIKKFAADKSRDIAIANFGIDIEVSNSIKVNIIYSNRLHKGIYRIDKIIHAFAAFLKVHASEGWRLIIAGEGEETHNLKKLAEKLGVIDNTDFTGWVDKKKNSEFYSVAKIYISVPETDATSISLLEAMAAGCIPVVSNLPANAEWITDNVNGIIVRSFYEPFIERALRLDSDTVKKTNKSIIEAMATKQVNKIKFIEIYNKILA